MTKVVKSNYPSWSSCILDSCATYNIKLDRTLFGTYFMVSGSEIKMGTNGRAENCERQDVEIVTMAGRSLSKSRLQNVVHLLDFAYFLIFVSIVGSKGVFTAFWNGCWKTWQARCNSSTSSLLVSLMVLGNSKQLCTLGCSISASLELLNEWLSHINEYRLAEMAQSCLAQESPKFFASF